MTTTASLSKLDGVDSHAPAVEARCCMIACVRAALHLLAHLVLIK